MNAYMQKYIHIYTYMTGMHTYIQMSKVINSPPSGSQMDFSGLQLHFEVTISQYLICCDTALSRSSDYGRY